MKTLLTLREAARKLGVHVTTMRRWTREGRVPSFRVGRRFVRVEWGAVLAALEDRRDAKGEEE